MRKAFLSLLIIACVWGTPATEAADKWLSVRSKNFLLVGNASESSIRRVGRTLEEFRAGFALLFPAIGRQAPPPITVVVFKDDTAFRPFKPLYQGKPANVAGYFQSGQDVNYIALTGDTETPRIIYHEFVHALTRESGAALPPWASEGLAEVYSTFQIESNGKEMLLGKGIADHIQTLQHSSIPIGTLFQVDHSSPFYNEQTKQGIFYAESWAVMHYLMLANNRQHEPQLSKFLSLLSTGAPADESFREAFQTDIATFEKQLQEYVGRFAFPAVMFKSQAKIDFEHDMQVSGLSEAQADYYLGDLLSHMGREDAAEGQLQKAISLDPNFGPSYASMGMLRVRQKNSEEALQFLTRAVQTDTTNYMVHYYYAFMLQAADAHDTSSASKERLQSMREHLKQTVELAPDYWPAYDMLGYVSLVSGEELPPIEDLLKKALTAAPGNRQLRLRLTEVMITNNEPAAARVILTPLKNVSDDPAVERRVDGLLNDIQQRIDNAAALREYNDRQRAAAEARARAAAAIQDSTANITPDGPPRIRRIETPATSNDSADETTARPVVRPEGKQIEGSLLLIDCAQGITLRVRVQNSDFELHSDDPSKIEFVSYTSAVSGSFSCGQFKTEPHVLIVYKTSANPRYLGEPLRVEFTK